MFWLHLTIHSDLILKQHATTVFITQFDRSSHNSETNSESNHIYQICVFKLFNIFTYDAEARHPLPPSPSNSEQHTTSVCNSLRDTFTIKSRINIDCSSHLRVLCLGVHPTQHCQDKSSSLPSSTLRLCNHILGSVKVSNYALGLDLS